MIKHYSFILVGESNFTNTEGKSFTDKSKFRPDSINLRDKAIALNATGGGMTGLYDDTDLDDNTKRALAYARKPNRDITEIEHAKDVIEKTIERKSETDKQNLETKQKEAEIKETLNKIASNTEKTTDED